MPVAGLDLSPTADALFMDEPIRHFSHSFNAQS